MIADSEWVTRARAGDRDAWALLMRRHAPRLAAYLGARLRRPAVVEKLVEDAVVLAYRHIEEANAADFSAWFRRVGAHVALRWYREHRDEPLTEAFPVSTEDTPDRQADLALLEKAVGRLTDAQRMAVEQRYRGGLGGSDLAAVLHCEPEKAERMVEDALVALERALSKAGG